MLGRSSDLSSDSCIFKLGIHMMTLHEINFDQKFYWKGKKYKQFIRPKNPISNSYKISCYALPQGDFEWFPSGRKVKPIVRIENKQVA